MLLERRRMISDPIVRARGLPFASASHVSSKEGLRLASMICMAKMVIGEVVGLDEEKKRDNWLPIGVYYWRRKGLGGDLRRERNVGLVVQAFFSKGFVCEYFVLFLP